MNKIKVLIVEDESIVALDIQKAILSMGYEVTEMVTNYDEAIASVKKTIPDIMLLDINLLNSKDGIEIAKEVQKIKNIPIIYLTAYTDDESMAKAVETNPIGYLTKPFKRDEIKSTILLGIHKANRANQIIKEEGSVDLGFGYYYDLSHENLYYQNRPVKLSVKERKLFTLLVESKGSIVPFNIIEFTIWPDEPVSESTLRTLLYRLRGKLKYDLIITEPAFGLKLIPKI